MNCPRCDKPMQWIAGMLCCVDTNCHPRIYTSGTTQQIKEGCDVQMSTAHCGTPVDKLTSPEISPEKVGATPETDAYSDNIFRARTCGTLASTAIDMIADFARKLERERDEARKDVFNCRQVIDTYSRQEDDLIAVTEERDQLKAELKEVQRHLRESEKGARINAHCANTAIKKRLEMEKQFATLLELCEALAGNCTQPYDTYPRCQAIQKWEQYKKSIDANQVNK